MNKFKVMKQCKLSMISGAILVTVAALSAAPVMAVEIGSGEWNGSLDTTVSYGASWRIDDYDPNDVGNSPTGSPPSPSSAPPHAPACSAHPCATASE